MATGGAQQPDVPIVSKAPVSPWARSFVPLPEMFQYAHSWKDGYRLVEVWHMSGHSSSIYIKADAIEEETRQIREWVRKELRSEIKDLKQVRSPLVKQLEKLLELKNAHQSTRHLLVYAIWSGMNGRATWGPVRSTLTA